MATYGNAGGRPHGRFGRLLDALFGEAWELRRRRRRRRALAWLLALAAGGAVYLGLSLAEPGPRRPSPVSAPVAAVTRGSVTSESLPRAGQYSSLATIGGKLIVWGGAEGSIASVPAATAAGLTCQAAQVDPRTLALTGVRRGNCADPALYRERVLPDLGYARGGPSGDIGTVRISVVSRTARAGYSVGPVLVRYDECSDCNLSVAYGDGSLWIYAPNLTSRSPQFGQLLRISEQTGRVVQRWRLPSLAQALLATDRDGLWIAPSLFSGEPEHVRPAQQREYGFLYRVAPGMRTPQRTFRIGVSGARWLVAAGTSVWLDTGTPSATRLIRLDGPDARPTLSVRQGVPDCLALGKGPSSIAGDDTGGIYCLGSTHEASATVFRFSPRSGVVAEVATIPDVDATEFEQPAAAVGDSFFFVQPPDFSYGPAPAEKATAHGSGVLYRVRPR